MRVLFPLEYFYPSKIGGPANTLYWLCKALIGKGYNVVAVATGKGIEAGRVDLDRWLDVDGIETCYCSATSKMPFSVIAKSIGKLSSVDVVVLSSLCFAPNFFVAFMAKFKGKKIIWSPRGELFDSAINNSKGKNLFFSLVKILFGKRVIFQATSEVEKKAILRHFPNSKVVIIPNYMEIPEKEDVETDYTDFLYVGRIAPIKALDKLIKGLAESRHFRDSRYKLKLVGSVEHQFNDYYKSLQALIKELKVEDKILFVGSLSGKDKFQAYASARYSFLVSDSENFGNVVIEALSQGTPVVASKGTPWERLNEEEAGFWIENTPEEIAKTIDAIIEQTEDNYIRYRNNALELSASFDVYKHVEEWEKVFMEIV